MRLSRTIALPISSREFAQWLVPFQSPFYNNHNYVKQPISNSQQDAITKKKVDPEPFHLLPKSDNVHLRARNIGIAVSGGVDSMALVTLLARHYQSQRNDYSNVANLHAFIVDHKLRDNSTEEATFVAEQVQKLNVAPHVLTLDWTETESSQFYTEDNDNQSQRYNSNISIQRPDKTHLETKARLERYKAIAKQCHSLQIKDLFVGHHSGDQVETVVFRFSRASGIDGLAGIQDVAPLGVLNVMEGLDIRLVRPLLNASKERLRATCEDAGTLWVEDPSNQSLDYQRNVIRHYQHDVDESVKNDAQSKLFMLSTDSILEFRQRINKHRQFAWEQVKPWLNNVHFDSENGVCHVRLQTTRAHSVEWLCESQNHVASRLLSFLVRWVNCKDHAPRLDDIQTLLKHLRQPAAPVAPSSTKTISFNTEGEGTVSTLYRRKRPRVSRLSSQQPIEMLSQDKECQSVQPLSYLQLQPINIAGVLFSPPRKSKGIPEHWTISRQPMSNAEQMTVQVYALVNYEGNVSSNRNEVCRRRLIDLLWDQRFFIRVDAHSLLECDSRAQVQKQILIRTLTAKDIPEIRQTIEIKEGQGESLTKLLRWMKDIPGNARFTIPVVYYLKEPRIPSISSQDIGSGSSNSLDSGTLLSLPTLGIHLEQSQFQVTSWFKSRNVNIDMDSKNGIEDVQNYSISLFH